MHGTFGQGQLVRRGGWRGLVINLGLHLAGGLAVCASHAGGGRAFSQLPAEFVEVLALGDDGLPGFTLRNSARLIGARHFKNSAGLEPVDVAAYKSVRVAAQQGHQHLVK